MSGKLSRYRRLAPHLMQHSQRRALPDSNRTDLSREAFAWLSIVLALRLALASSSVSSDMVTSSPSTCNLRWRHRVRPNAERRCNGSPGSRLNQLVRRLSRLNLGTISLAQSSVDSNVAFAHPAGFCPTIFLGMSPSVKVFGCRPMTNARHSVWRRMMVVANGAKRTSHCQTCEYTPWTLGWPTSKFDGRKA
jgi:hypothetical protein